MGCESRVSPDVYSSVCRPVFNDMGPLAFVKDRRNGLAHGELSFEQCGSDTSVQFLDSLSSVVLSYLDEVVNNFELFLDENVIKKGVRG